MLVLSCLLCALCSGALGGPFQRGAWFEKANPFEVIQTEAPRLSFYHLPTFQHAAGPLVARELFRPDPHKKPLPSGLTMLLLPDTTHNQIVPGSGGRAVEVHCGIQKISLRLDLLQLGAWTRSSLFRLGSCQASRITPRFLYFHYRLTECDGESKVVGGQLIYSFTLNYMSPPQGLVIRVPPVNLPIFCHYNRFHYSYKVGFKPQVQLRTFVKSIRSELNFSLSVCNGRWEPLPPGHWFSLGEPVYFLAHTGPLLTGERLYVDSCYTTTSRDPNSMPKVDIIKNYGCLTDSRREDSNSRFFSGWPNVLKFSVDAFVFRAVSQVLYLHCSMSVGLTTSYTSKSCNYNKAAGRWEELEAPPSVCACCDSRCTEAEDFIKNTVSSPGWFIGQEGEEKPKKKTVFQSEDGRNLVDQEEKRIEKIDEHQTLPQEKEDTITEKTSVLYAEKKELKHSIKDSQQEMEEKDEAEDDVEEMAESLQMETDGLIMDDQTSPNETEIALAKEEVPCTKNGSVSGLFC